MTNRIVLDLPDTPEMRDLIATLGVHCVDDNVGVAETKLADAQYGAGNDGYTQEDCDAEIAANEAFNDIVTKTLHFPHLLTK